VKVLIAEDDATCRQILKSLLMGWGYDVVLTEDGAEAWRVLNEAAPPRLCLLDRMMPGRDGLEVCRKIRKNDPERAVYVIMVTVKGSKKDIADGFEAGADDYVTKPYDADELRVRVALGKRIVQLSQALGK
jgi:two-component system, cell cycle response regulator